MFLSGGFYLGGIEFDGGGLGDEIELEMNEGNAVSFSDQSFKAREWSVFDADAGAHFYLRGEDNFVIGGIADSFEDIAELGIKFVLESDLDDAGAVIALENLLFGSRADAEEEVAGEEWIIK